MICNVYFESHLTENLVLVYQNVRLNDLVFLAALTAVINIYILFTHTHMCMLIYLL